MLGLRSGVERVRDRYQVKVDKASQIKNDPNDWSREVEAPRYILDLLGRVVTVSTETVQIVADLPQLKFDASSNAARPPRPERAVAGDRVGGVARAECGITATRRDADTSDSGAQC